MVTRAVRLDLIARFLLLKSMLYLIDYFYEEVII